VFSTAAATYEDLRADVLAARPCAEGRAALRYHGMLQGLAILLRPVVMLPSTARAPASAPLPLDNGLVRLLANLVLHTHSELTHVC
jgi:hypothetical protein